MLRFKIVHDRDRAVIGDNHWNCFMLDTDNPHVEQPFVWGSHAACLAYALGVLRLRQQTGVR